MVSNTNLTQCIETEREAVSRYRDAETCTPDEVEKLQALKAARAATDEAVRAVEDELRPQLAAQRDALREVMNELHALTELVNWFEAHPALVLHWRGEGWVAYRGVSMPDALIGTYPTWREAVGAARHAVEQCDATPAPTAQGESTGGEGDE
jgi:hypothetical protein